jgi:hypothetical protein
MQQNPNISKIYGNFFHMDCSTSVKCNCRNGEEDGGDIEGSNILSKLCMHCYHLMSTHDLVALIDKVAEVLLNLRSVLKIFSYQKTKPFYS